MNATNQKTADERPDQVYAKLKRFNLVMGFLHFIQGILMIVLSNDTTYPIYTNFLKLNTDTFPLLPGSRRLPAALGGGPFRPGDLRLQLVCA